MTTIQNSKLTTAAAGSRNGGKTKNWRRQAGFTLIEVLVAVALFSITLLIVIGVYGQFTDTQRREIGEQQLQEDMRVVFEQFNREARTAFGTTFPDGDTGSTVRFRNQNGLCVQYALLDQAVVRTEATASEAAVSCNDPGLYPVAAQRPLTDSEVVIEAVRFLSLPAQVDGDDQLQSQGLISMLVTARPAGVGRELRLQSSVASQQVVTYEIP